MKNYPIITDYRKLLNQEVPADHKIGEDIMLMDFYCLSPFEEYEYTLPNNTFIELASGNGYIIVNDKRYDVNGHCLIGYLKGQKVKICVSGKAAVQRGVSFSDNFMEEIYRSSIKFNDLRTSIIVNPVVRIGKQQIQGIDMYYKSLCSLASYNDNPNRLTCAIYITTALFYGPLYSVLERKLKEETMRSPLISSRFFTLLSKDFKEHNFIYYYADCLGISKAYLYDCVSSTTGKSPCYWLDYYRLAYAKQSLSDFDLSIQQIAENLHFAGLPQFGKFFRKKTGMSPREYRKSLL